MIKGLDSFRFFAFFAVYLDHIEVLPSGYAGVLAFFVLSGFLLTPILDSSRTSTFRSSPSRARCFPGCLSPFSRW